MPQVFKIFGIRHHGPGSAQALINALKEWQPDTILVEGPADADKLLPYISPEKLKPPVAILVYNPNDLRQAAFFPFAEFSPEWQALKLGLKNNWTVAFMDLPMSIGFGLKNADAVAQETSPDLFNPIQTADTLNLEHDPLKHLAILAGYTDSERWWEKTFEQTEHPVPIFETIRDMMTALRQNLNRAETTETLLREAYMRQTIRQHLKKGAQRIAVVCGAWHAPVLDFMSKTQEKTDADALKNALKNQPKLTTEATWMAWSYERLTRASGYGAGILSPAWYAFLFSDRGSATVRWLTKAARLLRKADLSASSAHVMEAVRLSETLAILRGYPIAGLAELEEATKTVICLGAEAPLQLIRKKLVVGDVVGKVSPDIPQVPLQRDLEATIKAARLKKEYESSEAITKELDLRKPNQLLASKLLYRLNLLGIPWGKAMKGSRYKLGSFKETWKLHWRPDYAIRIIEAAQWGNRIEEAANHFVHHKTASLSDLAAIADLVHKTLEADLPRVLPALISKMQTLAALTDDVMLLMEALPPLVQTIRYGNVRKTDLAAVEFVLEQMAPRIFIGLPNACLNTDEASSTLIFNKLQMIHHALNLLARPDFTAGWLACLKQIARSHNVQGQIAGTAVRLVFDKSAFTLSQTAMHMRYALSPASEPLYVAAWLEGFLHGSALFIIHHEALWQVLDEWVETVDLQRLEALLPLFRRSFGRFSPAEKSKIFQLAQSPKTLLPHQAPSFIYDADRAKGVLARIRQFV